MTRREIITKALAVAYSHIGNGDRYPATQVRIIVGFTPHDKRAQDDTVLDVPNGDLEPLVDRIEQSHAAGVISGIGLRSYRADTRGGAEHIVWLNEPI
ncbi:MAG: hypothetical protein WCG99_03310 [Candidatus Berkelbacteria bacterium]